MAIVIGKTEAQQEHFIAHNSRKRCIRKGFCRHVTPQITPA